MSGLSSATALPSSAQAEEFADFAAEYGEHTATDIQGRFYDISQRFVLLEEALEKRSQEIRDLGHAEALQFDILRTMISEALPRTPQQPEAVSSQPEAVSSDETAISEEAPPPVPGLGHHPVATSREA